VRDRLVRYEYTCSKFLNELRVKFYPVTIQQQKKKEFNELKMTSSIILMQYASKFTKLSSFVPEFVAFERKMRRFNEDLAFYIHNQAS